MLFWKLGHGPWWPYAPSKCGLTKLSHTLNQNIASSLRGTRSKLLWTQMHGFEFFLHMEHGFLEKEKEKKNLIHLKNIIWNLKLFNERFNFHVADMIFLRNVSQHIYVWHNTIG